MSRAALSMTLLVGLLGCSPGKQPQATAVPAAGAPAPRPEVRAVVGDPILECRGGLCVLTGDDTVRSLGGEPLGGAIFVGVAELDGERRTLTTGDGEVTIGGRETMVITPPRPRPDATLLHPLAITVDRHVLFDDGRIFELTPPLSAACEGCWKPTPWRVENDQGEEPSRWDAPEVYSYSKGLVVWMAGGVLVSLRDGEQMPRMALRAETDLGAPTVVGDDLYVSGDKLALRLSLPSCRAKPGGGPADLTGEGCVKGRLELPETAYARPAVVRDSAYFLSEGRVYQLHGSEAGWVAEIEGDSILAVEHRGAPMLLATQRWTSEHPARLLALDPESGKTLMQADLEGSEHSITEVALGRSGDAILALTSGRLYRWELDRLRAAWPD